MWHFNTKKSNASKNWHAKAMMVDPRKTKIIILDSQAAKSVETFCNIGTTNAPIIINSEGSIADDFAENTELLNEVFGTAVSAVLVED